MRIVREKNLWKCKEFIALDITDARVTRYLIFTNIQINHDNLTFISCQNTILALTVTLAA